MKGIRINTILFCLFIWFPANTQSLINFPCYAIAYDIQPNELYRFDTAIQDWVLVGSTGTQQIEAIATDPIHKVIYAFDNNTKTLGTLNTETGMFDPIGKPTTGKGDYGEIMLNYIKGLSYDLHRNAIFATHRISGSGPNTNDVLFKMNIDNGQIVKNVMIDSNSAPCDYAKIQEIFDRTNEGEVYDVEDIAYDPFKGGLYAIQNQSGPGVLSYIDPKSGEIEMAVHDFANDNLSSLAMSYFGFLYSASSQPDVLAPPISYPNSTLNILGKDAYVAFDCFTAINDLALSIKRSPNTPEIVAPGDLVTFDITVFNQGDFDNDQIKINNYIPEGLTLNPSSNNWTVNGSLACHTINSNIKPGDSITVQISFTANAGFTGSVVNAAEIVASFNSSIVDNSSMPIVLLDVDSQSNNFNDETGIKDNDILGKGIYTNEDEDDHDIAQLAISNCTATQNINGVISTGTYVAGVTLNINQATIPLGNNTITLIAGECITVNNFEVSTDTDFSAKIASCGE